MDAPCRSRPPRFPSESSRRNALRDAIGSAGLASGSLIASTIDSDATFCPTYFPGGSRESNPV